MVWQVAACVICLAASMFLRPYDISLGSQATARNLRLPGDCVHSDLPIVPRDVPRLKKDCVWHVCLCSLAAGAPLVLLRHTRNTTYGAPHRGCLRLWLWAHEVAATSYWRKVDAQDRNEKSTGTASAPFWNRLLVRVGTKNRIANQRAPQILITYPPFSRTALVWTRDERGRTESVYCRDHVHYARNLR